MKRKDFINRSALASGSMLIPGFLKPLEKTCAASLAEKALVVVQFSGGNDGLNTFVPYTNDIYYNKRKTIAIPATQILPLDETIGMNPSMAALQEVYDQGWMSVINEVGYPNPDRSHFRSMDIWQTASNSNEFLSSGWIGRYLDNSCSGRDKPYAAIEVDDSLSLAMKGLRKNGMAVKNSGQLYQTTREPFFKDVVENRPMHLSEDNLGYLYKTLISTYSSADYIFKTTKSYKSTAVYPASGFASQLKTISQFINSGLPTRVYYVSLGGFDTHVGQIAQQGKTLRIFSEGMAAFLKDLNQAGSLQSTMVMVFSEFGRRVEQNSSNGTDHGTANNIMLFGGSLKQKGILSDAPDLANLQNGDLVYKMDFRSVYATLLQNWLGAGKSPSLNSDFKTLTFV